MATLILGAVGTLVGGPVGGIVGTLVGRSIDGGIFKPKGSEGPRLTDLSVQTSSYGSAIPRVFGTMRVAGSVIWSTDLIEQRTTTGHGKGQPSTTTYSYAASFAVLLSGRRIAGVGRIWADGNLLRGSAGDFKTATGFRLHLGDDDQDADPLIASAEGGATPACRGCAYAVFENLQLADYGNRLPSLTFEVIADAAPVAIGAIARELGDGAVADGGVAATLDGYSAEGSVRDNVALLAQAGGARLAPSGDGLRMLADTVPAQTIADAGYAANEDRGPRSRRTIAALETVPRTLSLAYYDAARDYQIGSQRARRPGPGVREDRIALPAVIAAGRAKALAETLLRTAEIEREQRTIALAADAAAIAPGTAVVIAGEAGTWRVTEAALEQMVATLTLVRLAPATATVSASPGRVLPAPDLTAGRTILTVAELPALDDVPLTAPRLGIVAAGTGAGWRRAALLYSLDGESWRDGGATAAPGVIGTVVVPPGSGSATLVDDRETIDVLLARADMMLADADDTRLDRGANLTLVGDELLQFGRAEPLGAARWRLSRLLRGRRGTEAAIGHAAVGDRFALLAADTVASLDLPVAALGSVVRVIAAGIGDGDDPPAVACAVTGRSVVPPSPARLRIDPDGVLRWSRRSRAGFRWIDGGDVPLVEETESYRVDIAGRTVVTNEPTCPLLPGETVSGTVVAVRQRGTFGESLPATLIIP